MSDERKTGRMPPLKLYWWHPRPDFGDAAARVQKDLTSVLTAAMATKAPAMER